MPTKHTRWMGWTGVLISLLLLAGCDASESDGFIIEPYLGTYGGPITAELSFPEGGGTTLTADATATFSSSADGQVTFVLDVDRAGLDPLVYEGTYDASGMHFQLEQNDLSFEITISEDGEISGGGAFLFFGLTLEGEAEGQLTPERMDLMMDLVVLRSNTSVPEGSMVFVTFEGKK